MSSYAESQRQPLPRRKLALMKEYELLSYGNAASRFDADRFFHVMGHGWYIEISGGEIGPFPTHATAENFFREINRSSAEPARETVPANVRLH